MFKKIITQRNVDRQSHILNAILSCILLNTKEMKQCIKHEFMVMQNTKLGMNTVEVHHL